MSKGFFKIYNNVGVVNAQAMILDHASSGEPDKMYRLDLYSGHTALETIQYHRDIVRPNRDYIMNLFIIIDRLDIANEGVLLINLEPEHGFVDGLRYPASQAANVVASLDIYNETWEEDRETEPCEKTALSPFDWFAVYNLLSLTSTSSSLSFTSATNAATAKNRKSFRSALFYLDDGVSSLGYDSDWEGFEDDERRRMMRGYYRPIETESHKNIDEIVADHAQYAESNSLDPVMFVIVDDINWEERGFLFVKKTPDGVLDRFRRKGPTAGEMLNWIFVGLMTWKEAKNWNTSSVVTE